MTRPKYVMTKEWQHTEMRYCLWCGAEIVLGWDDGMPAPRNDRKFCDDACRQAHHRSLNARRG